MCLSLSATVILFCLFMPKLNVVLLKPNKNVRVKSSNIVKSVYKTQSQLQQQPSSQMTTGGPNTSQIHLSQSHKEVPSSQQPSSKEVPSMSAIVPATTEKSLTIATGVSCASTPSSPGPASSGGTNLNNNNKKNTTNILSTSSSNQITNTISSASVNNPSMAASFSSSNTLLMVKPEVKCVEENETHANLNETTCLLPKDQGQSVVSLIFSLYFQTLYLFRNPFLGYCLIHQFL